MRRVLGEAASVHDTRTQRRENRVDARRGPIPRHSLQDDRDNDASGLRLRGQGEALEGCRNGEIDPNQSQKLH